MTEGDDGRLGFAEFHALDGLAGWRLLFRGPATHVATGGAARSFEVVAAVAAVVARTGVAPDLDVRPEGVTIRLEGEEDLAAHVETARGISSAVAGLGLAVDPDVQLVQLAVDVVDLRRVLPFWQAVLGYDHVWDEDLADPHRRNPPIWFQEVVEHRPGRGRLHVDVSVPHDVAQARIAAAVAAGGTVMYDDRAPMWWTLEDPEGNLVDVATWQGRG